MALFDLGYNLLNLTRLPFNLVFHSNELSDPLWDERISRQFGLNLPLGQKENVCRRVLSRIREHFYPVTTLEYASQLVAQGAV